MRLIKSVVTGFFCLCLFGCATFSKKQFRDDLMLVSKGQLNAFSGEYNIYPSLSYGKDKIEPYEKTYLWNHHNALPEILSDTALKIDSIFQDLKKYKVRISILDKTTLKVAIMNERQIINSFQFPGKLRRNGMFYLDNSFLKCHGLPYLLGGCIHHKRRIALSKNHDLIVDRVYDSSGAFLIVFASGFSNTRTLKFDRVGN